MFFYVDDAMFVLNRYFESSRMTIGWFGSTGVLPINDSFVPPSRQTLGSMSIFKLWNAIDCQFVVWSIGFVLILVLIGKP